MKPLCFAASGFAAVSLLMFALWIRQRKTNNAGIVDVGWAFSIAVLGVSYAIFSDGFAPRRALAAAMAALWGFRLAWHIHERSKGKPEDGRYQQLRRDWSPNVPSRMFLFFQLQAVVAVLFSIPFLFATANATPHLHSLEIIGFAVWFIAVAGESFADAQLNRFKNDGANRGKVCDAGLWKFSRHPNYFFEWLVWCGVALFASASPHGIWSVICPVLILYFLLRVTGIPATEEQSLRSKGDAYRDYQRRTSAFIPWFPKKI